MRDGNAARTQSVQAATAAPSRCCPTPRTRSNSNSTTRAICSPATSSTSYTSLINDVVIPGAKQQQISAVATVPKAGSVSADPSHAVVLVFVNQTVVVGRDAPSSTASSVRVTLDKVGDKWLISEFTPV